jgi:hypothetical protein
LLIDGEVVEAFVEADGEEVESFKVGAFVGALELLDVEGIVACPFHDFINSE